MKVGGDEAIHGILDKNLRWERVPVIQADWTGPSTGLLSIDILGGLVARFASGQPRQFTE